MGNLDQQTIVMIAGAILAGGLIGWLLGSFGGNRRLGKSESDWKARYEKALQQIEKLKTQTRALETSVETERTAGLKFKQAAVHATTELDSLREKANTLAKNVFTLGAERERSGLALASLRKDFETQLADLGLAQQQEKRLKQLFDTADRDLLAVADDATSVEALLRTLRSEFDEFLERQD